MHLTPAYNPWFWSPSPSNRRFSDPSKRSDTPSVEPCYFYETQNATAYLDVELPGVKKENINVEVKGPNLCITGKRYRKDRSEETDQNHDEEMVTEVDACFLYYLQMRLGPDADAEGITARGYDDGVLTLAIPIKTSDQSRKVQIQI